MTGNGPVIEPGPATAVARAVARHLSAAGMASPDADARQLVAHVIGVGASRLFTADVDAAALPILTELVTRRGAGEPLQHLTGVTGFRTIEVSVGPGVFIPRPETETMVQAALDWILTERLRAPRVVDLCTGSGVIAAALAAELGEADVDADIHAVELSDEALDHAHRNLSGTGVHLHAGDMAQALPEFNGTVDVVISNPPYVPLEAWESVPAEVRDHDPHLALFSGDDGLDAMHVVSQVARRLLKPGGLVLAEHAEVQHDAVIELFTADGWAHVRDNRDLTGRWRFVTAIAPVGSGSSMA